MCQSSTSSFPINSHFCLHLLESLFLVTRRVLILSYVSKWNEQLLLVCLVHSLQHLQSPAWIRHSRNICCLNKQVSLGRRRVSWIYLSIHPSNSLSVCLSISLYDLGKYMGFPGGSDGKESSCNARYLGLIPGMGRSPGGGHGNLLFLPGESHGQEDPCRYSSWGWKESDTTEQLTIAQHRLENGEILSTFLSMYGLWRKNEFTGLLLLLIFFSSSKCPLN